MDDVTVLCPYCGEPGVLELELESHGSMVQDCEVCCRPWQLVVTRDEAGAPRIEVTRAS